MLEHEEMGWMLLLEDIAVDGSQTAGFAAAAEVLGDAQRLLGVEIADVVNGGEEEMGIPR